MTGNCLIKMAVAVDDAWRCRQERAFLITAYTKEEIIMINEPRNFAKVLSMTVRYGWLGD